jgi:hypothetical protein
MKTIHKRKSLLAGTSLIILIIFILGSCNKDLLDEVSLSNPSTAQVLSTKAGFNTYMTALHKAARDENTGTRTMDLAMQIGTDVGTLGDITLTEFVDYKATLTPSNSGVTGIWNWAYSQMIARANTIIVYANKSDPSIWASEAEKKAIIAEAKFFRAYTYSMLAILYGGVPIVDTVYETPKVDFVRATRQQVYEFAKNDLVYASAWLPPTVTKTNEGRIVKAAADHLLSEVYICLGDYDNAILSASAVINSGLYNLMTTRFGSESANPGDVFSDLFRDNNQNRSSGNKESIYVFQYEDVTPGGIASYGNNWLRAWGPRYFALTDPAGKSGMVVCDSMGRGVGWIRPTSYFIYDIWQSDFNNDMRNSRFNIRRTFVYNNPSSAYYRQVVGPRTTNVDTMWYLYPAIRKIEGKVGKTTNNTYGRTYVDIMRFRLAETYLLRAEAYIRKGASSYANAAADINVVRSRAHATPVDPADISIDYLLDERARELMVEEPRRRTLMRMGKLVERVRLYNLSASTRASIEDYHELWPIPQTAIDANFGAVLEQNPGYN